MTAAVLTSIAACTSTPNPGPDQRTKTQSEPRSSVSTVPESSDTSNVTVAPLIEPQGVKKGSIEDFQVNVGERVYFDLDQYRLSATAQNVLKRQAAWLSTYRDVNILIAGNCDERGTREYNLALGERRASVVKTYLVDLGVDPARIQTVSYGKEQPQAIGSNENAWAQNRNGFTQLVSGVTG